MMSLSWGLLAGCFIGPYVLGLYSKKINKIGVYASIITTLLINVAMIIGLGIMQTPNGSFGAILKSGIGRSPFIGVVSMAASFIVTPLFSLIFKKYAPSESLVASLFEK